MLHAGNVVRVDVEEALVTPEIRILSQRKVFWYVKVPSNWAADGTVQKVYSWRLDLDKLGRGEKLTTIIDRLHLALNALYAQEARAQQAAAPADLNRTQPLSVSYRLLSEDELAKRPWMGTQSLRLTEDGKLEKVADSEL
jgi:hypothetical protein